MVCIDLWSGMLIEMVCIDLWSGCVLTVLAYFFYDIFMPHASCCSKACMSTPDGRGHSWPPSAVGKVYREFALDHVTCHAFLYACTQIFCRPSNSLCDHSIRAAENRKTPIPFCAKSSAESSGISGWLLIRSRATLAFSRTTSLVALMSTFPVPQ